MWVAQYIQQHVQHYVGINVSFIMLFLQEKYKELT
jgi:hypothetical protein